LAKCFCACLCHGTVVSNGTVSGTNVIELYGTILY
jgi:hypothetical protein